MEIANGVARVDFRSEMQSKHLISQSKIEPQSGSYRIGTSQLVLEKNAVFSANRGYVKLRPMTFKTLKYLCEHRGKIVSKEQLVESIWVNRCVTDDSLVQCISEIRRILGRENKKYLTTIPCIGYSLEAAKAWTTPTIFVGPLGPIGECALKLITHGLCENITIQLLQLESTKIHVCTKKCPIRTDFYLTGSLQKKDEHIRLSAQLVDSKTHLIVWAAIYELTQNMKYFSQQDRLCRSIVRDVLTFLAALQNVEAYNTTS